MPFDALRWTVSRRPGLVVAAWALAAAVVGLTSPNLTKLAAEGQARLVPRNSESAIAADLIKKAWPNQSYESLAVVALHRPGGLKPEDHDYAQRLSARLLGPGKPEILLRVLGPGSPPEIADRLISRDRTVQLLLLPLAKSFVSPSTQTAVYQLQELAKSVPKPDRLEALWSGNAVLGRDYMENVRISLDRAAIATVFLLLGVLLAVYRSLWLALVPLATIGVGLVISRGILAWMATAGWEVSPLVELFLVVLLFGSGTDFCLFISWRFGEYWNAANPSGAIRMTLKRSMGALLTSAGTVIVGLSLMGLTNFKLFSSTGPSVALGLGLTLAATLTLTPSLLLLLARNRPRSFAGLTAPSSGFWDEVGHRVLEWPILTCCVTLAVMVPPAILGMRTTFIQDLVNDLPARTPSALALKRMTDPPNTTPRKFRQGDLAPLTVVIRSESDLGNSEGLALIDDVSRLLTHQRRLVEVRSATQPYGSPATLERARLASRLTEVNTGFGRMAAGALQLKNGLTQGAAKLRTAILLEDLTGISLTGAGTPPATPAPQPPRPAEPPKPTAEDPLISGLNLASAALFGPGRLPINNMPATPSPQPIVPSPITGPREQMLKELTRAAEGAGQIADGAERARREVTSILNDPVGQHALDRLLITPETVRENPALLKSFAIYLSPDHRLARIDLVQADRMFSPEALDQVETLRRQLREYLDESKVIRARALIAGPNAESADIRALTRRDQLQTWIIVPIGVFLILLAALRDPWACVNLVATMILTYAFALGAAHLFFVTLLGNEGLDWKVPYFLFVLLVAVGVDYNVFLMARLQEESKVLGLRAGIGRAIAQTGGLISSAAAITACSFAAFMFSPLSSLRELGFALVVGISVDAILVRPVLVPCGQWLLNRHRERRPDTPEQTPDLVPVGHDAD